MMRELVLKMSMSLDGFVCGPNNEADWIFASSGPDSTAWTMETLHEAGLHIMGAHTFVDMKAWWPTSSEVYAVPMNEIPKAVFSRSGLANAKTTLTLEDARRADTGTQGKRAPHAQTWDQAQIVTGDMAEGIKRLKSQDGKLILAHGGAGFAQSLIATGLIDEYRLLVHPVAVGQGKPIFRKLHKPLRLKLRETKSFASGAIAQVYRPA
jgi:dihydrofolate reductase